MWKMVSYAQVGLNHITYSKPCQDVVEEYNDENISIIALSDGCGSCNNAHIGANIVIKSAINFFILKFDEMFNKSRSKAVNMLVNHINKDLKSTKLPMDSLYATLLIVAVKGDRFIMAHAGDGVIGCICNGNLEVASKPCNFEFLNQTFFINSKEAKKLTTIQKGSISKDGVSSFILMSDGTGETFYNHSDGTLDNSVYNWSLYTSIANRTQISQDIKTLFKDVVTKNTYDDCSIAIMSNTSNKFNAMKVLSNEKLFSILKSYFGNNSKAFISRKYDVLNTVIFRLSNYDECSISEIAQLIGTASKLETIRALRPLLMNGIISCNYETGTIKLMD